MANKTKFVPNLNADLELKKLGTIMGLPVYIDMAGYELDDEKFKRFLMAQRMLADFFNPPEEETDGE